MSIVERWNVLVDSTLMRLDITKVHWVVQSETFASEENDSPVIRPFGCGAPSRAARPRSQPAPPPLCRLTRPVTETTGLKAAALLTALSIDPARHWEG